MQVGLQHAVFGENDLLLPQHRNDPIALRLVASEASGWPRSGRELLSVFLGPVDTMHGERLPVAGSYQRDGDVLAFRPAFGFSPGQEYVARTPCNGDHHQLTPFTICEELDVPSALVTAVYPSGAALPENVLRFYVHFSVPMAPHRSTEFVRLRDEEGVSDDAAFMQFKQELWNADRTRLTVLMDPGRIKRGVATNLELGPALIEGNRYELAIDGGWPSADGMSVLPRCTKQFSVAAPLRRRPSFALWDWTPPRPGTRDDLTIRFDRPFDRHLLTHSIRVAAPAGRPLGGESRIGTDETTWSFTPDDAWASSDVQVIVDEDLEDVAGNTFRELLDRELPNTSASEG